MARKVKSTPFARFLLVMIVLAPVAYIAASYFNGEDGIQNIKDAIGIESSVNSDQDRSDSNNLPSRSNTNSSTLSLQDQIDRLEKENTYLNETVKKQEREILKLKTALTELKSR